MPKFLKGKISYGRLLMSLCAVVYFVSYITRINFSAVMVDMIKTEGFDRVQVSAALTALFITYGTGQMVSGYLGDRFRPERLMSLGILVCGLANLAIPFCPSPAWMTAVWSVNGFAQAFMWPPIVKTLMRYLSFGDYKRGVVVVNRGSCYGTIAVYLLAPLTLKISSWRLIFFISGGFGVIMSGVILALFDKVESKLTNVDRTVPDLKQSDMNTERKRTVSVVPAMVLLMLAIVFQGMLRDGITSWMPTLISDTFNAASSTSILSGVILPIFSIFSYQVAEFMSRKLIKNELLLSGVLFLVGVAGLTVLRFLGANSMVLSIASIAISVGCMHGINLVLTGMTQGYLVSQRRISTMSGFLNACTYVGSALSTYGVALLTAKGGWELTENLWALMGLLGAVCCMVCVPRWTKIRRDVLGN